LNEERRVKLETEAKQRKLEQQKPVVPHVKKPKFQEYVPPLPKFNRQDELHIPSYNNGIIPSGAVNTHSIMDNLDNETKETQELIIAKSKQLAPAYNKGPYSLILESEIICLGKK